jgi:hypothetical protein
MTGTVTAPAGSHEHNVRVISVYATPWRFRGTPDVLQEHLSLGQLEEFYALFREQLPQVLLHRQHPDPLTSLAFEPTAEEAQQLGPGVKVSPAQDGVEVVSMDSWLFVLPSNQVVAALDFTLQAQRLSPAGGDASAVDPLPTIRLLERCSYARLNVDGRSLAAHVSALAGETGAELIPGAAEPAVTPDDPGVPGSIPPERHQIVFATRIQGPTGEGESLEGRPLGTPDLGDVDTIKRILYRVEPPNRPEFIGYRSPTGLNQPGTLCAVTPYVSLLSDHKDYVENSVFLTVVQAVGTAARFRQIWHKAHGQVREFRAQDQDETVGTQRRESLERLVDEMGNMELDLSFSVESSADLGLLIPSLRIESFHRDLYAALELQQRAETVSRMFSRLDASIRSELIAIDIRERREAESKRLRSEYLIGIPSSFTVAIGILGVYFATIGTQVNQTLSIFDLAHYWPVYAVAVLLSVIPFGIWTVFNRDEVKTYRQERKKRLTDRRSAPPGSVP